MWNPVRRISQRLPFCSRCAADGLPDPLPVTSRWFRSVQKVLLLRQVQTVSERKSDARQFLSAAWKILCRRLSAATAGTSWNAAVLLSFAVSPVLHRADHLKIAWILPESHCFLKSSCVRQRPYPAWTRPCRHLHRHRHRAGYRILPAKWYGDKQLFQ